MRRAAITSPRARAALRELGGVIELPRLAWRTPSLLHARRGDGRPVLVLPGRSVDDTSTLPLRLYLRTLGHSPHGWGLGTNDGDFGRLVPAVTRRVEQIVAVAGGPIPLVGQSMGGAIAREVAKERPDLVRRIITLGSPIMRPRNRTPLRCPLTVIYSEADQIVPPRWALGSDDDAEVIQVSSTHFSMGVDPDVWAIVADRLTRSA